MLMMMMVQHRGSSEGEVEATGTRVWENVTVGTDRR